jgi:hypothetical protein
MGVPPLIGVLPDAVAVQVGQNNSNVPAGSQLNLFPPNGRDENFDSFNGVRVSAGYWFGDDQRLGVDGSAFTLERGRESYAIVSPGSPAITRSFIGANNGQNIFLLFAVPGQYGGLLGATVDNRFRGWEANLRTTGYSVVADRTEWLAGFRYVELFEGVRVAGGSQFGDGSRDFIADRIVTSNQFYGGQVGIHSRYGTGRVRADGILKAAVGGMHQVADISGQYQVFDPAGTRVVSEPIGLYAQRSNSGRYSRDRIAIVPEFTFNVSYQFTPGFGAFVGYNIIYMSSVLRPAGAVDPVINEANLPYIANPAPGNADRPQFRFNATDYWAQGINFGLKLEY